MTPSHTEEWTGGSTGEGGGATNNRSGEWGQSRGPGNITGGGGREAAECKGWGGKGGGGNKASREDYIKIGLDRKPQNTMEQRMC